MEVAFNKLCPYFNSFVCGDPLLQHHRHHSQWNQRIGISMIDTYLLAAMNCYAFHPTFATLDHPSLYSAALLLRAFDQRRKKDENDWLK